MKCAREIGEATGLAGAEHELRSHEREAIPNEAGGGGETRPPQYNAQQHAARTHAIAHEAAGHFEQRVCERECAQAEAHLLIADGEIFLDERSDHGDGDTVDIGDHR